LLRFGNEEGSIYAATLDDGWGQWYGNLSALGCGAWVFVLWWCFVFMTHVKHHVDVFERPEVQSKLF
jgi:hypothetical protein